MEVKVYQLAAFDLDGTLLRSDSTISDRTLSALEACRAAGMKLIVATGRSPKTASMVLPETFSPTGLVCYNGAQIWNGGGCLAQNALEPDLAKKIIRAIRRVSPQAKLYAGIDDVLYCEHPKDPEIFRQVTDLPTLIDTPVAKVVLDEMPTLDADLIRGCLPAGCRFIITCGGRLGEIMTPTATKAWGLRTLAERWGIDMSEVIAFGDETNDAEMIAESGFGVAMANAHSEILGIADHVTASNDEDGVAVMLEGLLAEA